MIKTHIVVPYSDDSWAIKDQKENRLLSPRFKTRAAANEFISMIVSPSPRGPMITIGEVARELNVNPFRARAKLRDLGMKPEKGRWKFLANTPEYRFVREFLANLRK